MTTYQSLLRWYKLMPIDHFNQLVMLSTIIHKEIIDNNLDEYIDDKSSFIKFGDLLFALNNNPGQILSESHYDLQQFILSQRKAK